MQYDEKYWNERLDPDVPKKVQNAIKRVYSAYPPECMPQGLCDPMYIMNVICLELGIGDGKGHFKLREDRRLDNLDDVLRDMVFLSRA